MDIMFRIWPREVPPAAPETSLTERLKQLADGHSSGASASAPGEAGRTEQAKRPADAQRAEAAAMEAAECEAPAPKAANAVKEKQVPLAISPSNGNGAARVASVTDTAGEPAVATAVAESETRSNPENDPDPQNGSVQAGGNSSAAPVLTQASPAMPANGGRLFRVPRWGSKPPAEEGGDPVAQQTEIAQAAVEEPQTATSSTPAPAGASQQFRERLNAASGRPEPGGEVPSAPVQQAVAELQTARQQFEAELKARLDAALAEFERRIPAPLPVEDVTAQLEEKAKIAADKISREVQGQAWVMLNAVANELRSFRDQFGKEIQERVGLLDQATKQALQLKEKFEETLPKAEDLLRALSVSGQEASAQLQATSTALAEQLRVAREELSRETETRSETLRTLVQDCHLEEQRLGEQVEKLCREAEAAGDVLGRMADQSIERLNAGADEAEARVRSGLEKLAAEVERRILSGGLVEKATGQIERAAEQVVEPAVERILQAGSRADASVESLNRASQELVGRLDSARQEIELRLDGLVNAQQNLLAATMSGFQRKATEELGNLVERVVAESSEQLNDRLHTLFQDLLVTGSQQINSAARTTLNTLHQGLKDVFEAPAPAEVVVQSGDNATED